MLVFDTWQCAPSQRQPTCAGRQKLKGTLWRILGDRAKAIRSDTRGLTPLGTNGRKIAVLRGDGKVAILGSDGRAFGTTPVPGTIRGAALDGQQLVVLTPTRLYVYRLQSITLERSWALARTGAVRKLAGIGGGLAAYAQGRTIQLVRLSDGRRSAITVPGKGTVRAALTGAGLFYTYTLPHSKYRGRVAFISLR